MDDLAKPDISVVIATYNRADSVIRTLQGLANQSVPAGTFEVVVVSDGCQGDTAKRVSELDSPFPLRVIEQENSGPAVARNRGAEAARADLLVFLDDDIAPDPGFVAGHLAGHREAPCKPFVLIGYLPVKLATQSGLYASALRSWWEAMFDRMAEPAHRFAYWDVLSGNMSLPAAFFREVGGFQPALRCHEDYELGYRLLKARACFGFSREARGTHEEMTDLSRSLRRQFDEGMADVWLARHHPSIIDSLRLGGFRSSKKLWLAHWLAFVAPWLASLLAFGTSLMLAVADRLRLRRVWRRLCNLLLMHHYWRGVALAAGDRTQLAQLIAVSGPEAKTSPVILEIDLEQGLAVAEEAMNEVRPQELLLRWGRSRIGSVLGEADRERLHAGHLRPLLQHQFADELLRAAGLRALIESAEWRDRFVSGH